MHRYTTPTLPVRIKTIDFSEVAVFRLALQMGETQLLFIIPADDERVDAANNMIYLELTQEQTAQLAEGSAQIQARWKYVTGKVQASSKARVTVEDVFDQVII